MKQSNPSIRKPEEEKPGYIKVGLTLLPAISTALFIFAQLQLNLFEDSFAGYVKLAALAAGAYTVSYLVYRTAIEKAAPLANVGFRSAGALGLGSIAVVGSAYFLATYPGLISPSVEERRLQTYMSELVDYNNKRRVAADKNVRLIPVVRSIANDLPSKAECETTRSCVSLSASSGYGPTARTLETLALRAGTIADEAEAGLNAREVLSGELAELVTELDASISDETNSIWTRRSELRRLSGSIDQLLNRLDEVVPTATLGAYRSELETGVVIAGKPEATQAVNQLLSKYAGALDAVLKDIESDHATATKPDFPSRTGLQESLAETVAFAPVALVAFTIDVLFPIILWLYTFWSLRYLDITNDPDAWFQPRTRSDLETLTEMRPIALPERATRRLPSREKRKRTQKPHPKRDDEQDD